MSTDEPWIRATLPRPARPLADAYDLVDGWRRPAVDAAEELTVEELFDIRARIRGMVP